MFRLSAQLLKAHLYSINKFKIFPVTKTFASIFSFTKIATQYYDLNELWKMNRKDPPETYIFCITNRHHNFQDKKVEIQENNKNSFILYKELYIYEITCISNRIGIGLLNFYRYSVLNETVE